MQYNDFVGPEGYSHGWVYHGVPGSKISKSITGPSRSEAKIGPWGKKISKAETKHIVKLFGTDPKVEKEKRKAQLSKLTSKQIKIYKHLVRGGKVHHRALYMAKQFTPEMLASGLHLVNELIGAA